MVLVLAESLYTFMLCFVVLNVATASKNEGNQFYGLAIGFVIVAGGYGAGAISGGCFNPAVALSIECATFKFGLNWGWIYILSELLGAVVASLLFRLVRPDEFGWSPDYGLGSKLVSEFIGTYFLVLTVGLNVLGKSAAPVWSIAASLMSMIYALGSVSGAHFNPAVTVAICMSGRDKCKWIDGAAYIFTQICSGILAGYTYSGMHQGKSFSLVYGPDYGWVSAGLAEVIFTFILCFVVLSVATTQDPIKETFGLAIGSCVTVGGYAIGAVSGGSLNPAVSFGIAMSDAMKDSPWWNCFFYSGFELVGALLASGFFWLSRPSEYKLEAGSDSHRIYRH
jgi:aquaporin Z